MPQLSVWIDGLQSFACLIPSRFGPFDDTVRSDSGVEGELSRRGTHSSSGPEPSRSSSSYPRSLQLARAILREARGVDIASASRITATDWRRIAETLALEESLADCIFNAATTEWLDEAPLDAIVFTVIIMGIEEQADAKASTRSQAIASFVRRNAEVILATLLAALGAQSDASVIPHSFVRDLDRYFQGSMKGHYPGGISKLTSKIWIEKDVPFLELVALVRKRLVPDPFLLDDIRAALPSSLPGKSEKKMSLGKSDRRRFEVLYSGWSSFQILTRPVFANTHMRLCDGGRSEGMLFLPHRSRTLLISNCTGRLIIGSVAGTAVLHHVRNAIVAVAAQRVVLWSCHDVRLHILSLRSPTVIQCDRVVLLPYNVYYDGVGYELNAANLTWKDNLKQPLRPILLDESHVTIGDPQMFSIHPVPYAMRDANERQDFINSLAEPFKSHLRTLQNKITDINIELYASYVYLSMAAHFDRDDVALHNIAKFMRKSSDEEREHALGLMKYQNTRGGRVVMQNIERPEKDSWGSALEAFQHVLKLEKFNNQSLLELHAVGSKQNDVHMTSFLEEKYLPEQVESISEVAKIVTNLKRVGTGVGEYMFDKEHFESD